MRFGRCFAPALLVLALTARVGFAEPAPPPSSRASQTAPDSVHITLGRAAVSLYGPWKFTTGDSPIDPKTRQPLWAHPAFNDSHWENVDLTPASGAQNPITGTAGYVPGWTQRGHPGYWGYAWYRIRVHTDAEPGIRFALAGPSIDDAYQLYDNGILSGHFGELPPPRSSSLLLPARPDRPPGRRLRLLRPLHPGPGLSRLDAGLHSLSGQRRRRL